MGNYLIQGETLTNIANAIRTKTGKTESIAAESMATEISGISSGGLSINGIIKQYVVNSGATVNAGDFVEFVTRVQNGSFTDESASNISCCKVNEDSVLIIYNSKARVLRFTENGPELGDEVTLLSTSQKIGCASISNNRVVIGYITSPTVYYKILSISGLVIDDSEAAAVVKTFSYSANFRTSNRPMTSIGDTVLFTYSGGNSKDYINGYVTKIVVANDNTVTLTHSSGLGRSVMSGSTDLSAAVVDITKSSESNFACWVDNESIGLTSEQWDYYLYLGTVNTSGLNLTQVAAFSSAHSDSNQYLHCTAMTYIAPNKVALVFTDRLVNSSNYSTYLKIYETSGLSASLVYEETLSETKSLTPLMAGVSENRLLISYNGITRIMDFIETDEGLVASSVETSSGSTGSILVHSPTSATVIYNGGNGKFKNLIINSDSTVITEETKPTVNGIVVQPATSRLYNVGLANTSGAEGETVEVYVPTPKGYTVTLNFDTNYASGNASATYTTDNGESGSISSSNANVTLTNVKSLTLSIPSAVYSYANSTTGATYGVGDHTINITEDQTITVVISIIDGGSN